MTICAPRREKTIGGDETATLPVASRSGGVPSSKTLTGLFEAVYPPNPLRVFTRVARRGRAGPGLWGRIRDESSRYGRGLQGRSIDPHAAAGGVQPRRRERRSGGQLAVPVPRDASVPRAP